MGNVGRESMIKFNFHLMRVRYIYLWIGVCIIILDLGAIKAPLLNTSFGKLYIWLKALFIHLYFATTPFFNLFIVITVLHFNIFINHTTQVPNNNFYNIRNLASFINNFGLRLIFFFFFYNNIEMRENCESLSDTVCLDTKNK